MALRSKVGSNGTAVADPPSERKAAKSETSHVASIRIPRPERERVLVVLEGITALVVHRFGEKARKELIDSNTGKTKKKATKVREPRDPDQEYRDSLYAMPDGKGFGFPAGAFKSAATSYAGRYCEGINATYARGLFFIEPDDPTENLVRILGADGKPAKPKMRSDIVKIGGMTKVATPRWRGMFEPPWFVVLNIVCNDRRLLDSESVINMLEGSGGSVGAGEGRPERKGNMGWGMYRVLAGPALTQFLKRAKIKLPA